MGNEGWPHNTEIEINDENIYITRKFCRNNSFSCSAENNRRDDDPDHNNDALNNKCRNGSFEKSKFCDSPELEMPAVSEGPEDKGRTDCSKGEGWTHTQSQTPTPENVR